MFAKISLPCGKYLQCTSDLEEPSTFRDLSKPIGALTSERLSFFKVSQTNGGNVRSLTVFLSLSVTSGALPGNVREKVSLRHSLLRPRLRPLLPR